MLLVLVFRPTGQPIRHERDQHLRRAVRPDPLHQWQRHLDVERVEVGEDRLPPRARLVQGAEQSLRAGALMYCHLDERRQRREPVRDHAAQMRHPVRALLHKHEPGGPVGHDRPLATQQRSHRLDRGAVLAFRVLSGAGEPFGVGGAREAAQHDRPPRVHVPADQRVLLGGMPITRPHRRPGNSHPDPPSTAPRRNSSVTPGIYRVTEPAEYRASTNTDDLRVCAVRDGFGACAGGRSGSGHDRDRVR